MTLEPHMEAVCPMCQIGRLKSVQAVYMHVYEGTLVHVPDAPAWKCDLCGQTFFDSQALRRVEVLIGESGPPPNHHIEVLPVPPDEPRPTDESAPESRPQAKS